jgi:transposase
MKNEIAKILNISRETIDLLCKHHLIDSRSCLKLLLKNDFKEMKVDSPQMTNADIYFELSEKHKVSESTVYKWVNDYCK